MISLPGYDALALVSESDYTEVFRAVRQSDGEPVILKLPRAEYPDPRVWAEYRHELQVLQTVPDGIAAPALGLERVENRPMLVLQDVGASALVRRIRVARLPLEEALTVGRGVAMCLARLHEAGVLHRDVNPGNILTDDTGRVWLTDFGVSARLYLDAEGWRGVSELTAGPTAGTLAYLSPEQTGRMNRPVDTRSDVYSLGVTLYLLCTGRLPFSADDPLELVHAHLSRRPVSPSEVDSSLPSMVSKVILHCLEKDPDDRYQSATGLAFDLDACLESLRSRGNVPDFAIATKDWSLRLQWSTRLYGRDAVNREVVDVFRQVRLGGMSMVLLHGPAGCGKSALLRETRRMLQAETQHLAYVRFLPTATDVPYAMLFEAFGKAASGLMTLPDEEAAQWRTRLLAGLGEDAPLLESLIPHLSTLLGEQKTSARPSLAPSSADDLHRAIDKLLSVYATEENPLVLCFDDLQWADAQTLEWLCRLPAADLPHLLAVCTRTDAFVGVNAADENETQGAGGRTELLVQALLQNWQTGSDFIDIQIEPLTTDDVSEWLRDMLRTGAPNVAELSTVLLEKTGGNPFFLRQLLVGLHQSGTLRMNPASGVWQWDIDTVRRMELADNMVDHAISRLHQLPSDLFHLLTVAACIGNRFDADLLATVSGEEPAEVLVRLREMEEYGLVTAAWQRKHTVFGVSRNPEPSRPSLSRSTTSGDGHYEFTHPRLQQAAYGLLAEPLRREVHLCIARHLLSLAIEEREEWVNELTEHCRVVGALLDTPEERHLAAEAFLSAAKKARSANAYARAGELYREGAELLGDAGWGDAHQLAFSLWLGRMECHYACAEYDEMLAVGDRILSQSPTGAEAMSIYGLQMNLFALRDQFEETERVARESLATVGITLPTRVTRAAAMRVLRQMDERLSALSTAEIVHLPEATDPVAPLAARMLVVAANATPLLGRWWTVLISAKILELTLDYGMTPSSPVGLFAPAYCLGLESREYIEMTCRWAESILPLAERYAHDLRTPLNVAGYYSIDVAPWLETWSSVVRFQERYRDLAFQNGAAAFGVLHAPHLLMAKWASGCNLADLRQEAERVLQMATEYDVSFAAIASENALRVFARLQEVPSSPEEGLGFLERTYSSGQSQVLILSMTLQCFTALLLDSPEEGLRYAERVFALLDAEAEMDVIFIVNLVVLYALTLTTLGESGTGSHATVFRRLRRMLRLWADFNPQNFRPHHLLVEAEVYRLRGNRTRAMDLYDAAIAASKDGGVIHFTALASELAGRFYLAIDKPRLARPYLVESRYLFAEWGAAAKVRQMDERYAESLRTTAVDERGGYSTSSVGSTESSVSEWTTSGSSEPHRSDRSTQRLDLATILKMSQAISGEIDLGRLLTRLLELAMENAGARKGYWVLPRDGQWLVLSLTNADGSSPELDQASPLSQSRTVPQRIVQYVIRSGEPLVLHDAAHEGRFHRDPFVSRNKLRSVLCYPVRKQGTTVAILYLENDLAAHVFTAQRIEVLNLLSGQAAISIENAIVYETLEQRVTLRTAELQQALDTLQRTQRQMVESEKMASLGQLTAGVAHEINNPVNFVVSSTGPLRRDLEDLLSGLQTYESTLERHHLSAEVVSVREAFELDDVTGEIRQLLAGIEEGGKRTAEIVRGLRTFSRMDEDDVKRVSVTEGIDSTLMLLRNKYEPRIRIVREYSEVPDIECYPGKLNQVYMNLLSNAIHAIPGEGEIHIRVNAPQGTHSVRIRIHDTGIGMDKEVAERIFEPFFTTKDVGVGTGLGLSISYGIIERHHGTVTVDSAPGVGTTFTLQLPVTQPIT